MMIMLLNCFFIVLLKGPSRIRRTTGQTLWKLLHRDPGIFSDVAVLVHISFCEEKEEIKNSVVESTKIYAIPMAIGMICGVIKNTIMNEHKKREREQAHK